VKVVVFPWDESMRNIEDLGVTIGANLRDLSISIANLDPKTVCISADLRKVSSDPFKIADISASVELAYVLSAKAQNVTDSKFDSLIDRLNEMDLKSL